MAQARQHWHGCMRTHAHPRQHTAHARQTERSHAAAAAGSQQHPAVSAPLAAPQQSSRDRARVHLWAAGRWIAMDSMHNIQWSRRGRDTAHMTYAHHTAAGYCTRLVTSLRPGRTKP
eukprot:1864804-Prymnesium_polylepis.1